MSDNFALRILHMQLSEQSNYLRLAKEQVTATKRRLADSEAERDKRSRMVAELEEAINILEGIANDTGGSDD